MAEVVKKSLEFEVLKALELKEGQATIEELVEATKLSHSAVTRATLTLRDKGLIQVSEAEKSIYNLTDEGRTYAETSLPEKRLAVAISSLGGLLPLENAVEASGLPRSTTSLALGWIVKKGWGKIQKKDGKVQVKIDAYPSEGEDEKMLRQMLEGEVDSTLLSPQQLKAALELKNRKLLYEKHVVVRRVQLTQTGEAQLRKGLEFKPDITILTSELITSGKWREVKLREYDVAASPPALYPGKKHFYANFLEDVRSILLNLGFTEAEGPYVEMEFWNFDALFQPQDHPAREIHDSYLLTTPQSGYIRDKAYAARVKRVHEGGTVGSLGWRYKWSFDIARRLILRTQTTAVSMRYLHQHKMPPVKMFCISNVFRPDVLDARHATEFSQFEGIVMDKGLTFRHLLGYLQEIAYAMELGDVTFKPGYFPFTEPSVESFVKHPTIGWMEFVGAGIFRPEVVEPLGVKHPVLAWGIGIDRLAMAKLGVNDIRELRSKHLNYLQKR